MLPKRLNRAIKIYLHVVYGNIKVFKLGLSIYGTRSSYIDNKVPKRTMGISPTWER